MKRSPMKRTGPPPPQSAKRRAQQDERREIEPSFKYEPERCWVGLRGCTGRAEAWHELVGSGVGGSRTDRRNLCAACGSCNAAIERHPRRYALGLKVRSSDAVEGEGGLVPAKPNRFSLAEHWT